MTEPIKKPLYEKWFQRPNDPSKNWTFTDHAYDLLIRKYSNHEDFNFRKSDNKPEVFEPKKLAGPPTLLDTEFEDISNGKAKFPETERAKLIFETVDNLIDKTVKDLATKSRVFKDCSIVRVGSTSEGLKCGGPNEFDYNLMLPILSEYTMFISEENNGLLDNSICIDILGKEYIYDIPKSEPISFLLKDFSIFDVGVASDVAAAKQKSNSFFFDYNLDDQRLGLHMILPELDQSIQESINRNLPETLDMLPRTQVREFNTLNRIAFTSTLIWKEDGLLIDIDLALVIPAYKKPLWYELDVYLKDRGWSMSVETVQLLNSKEIFNYVVRSEIECRLSY